MWNANKNLVCGLFYAIIGLMYLTIGHWVHAADHAPLMFQFEQHIPFIPLTVWLYLGLLIWCFVLGTLLINQKEDVLHLLKSMTLAAVLHFTIFLIFPLNYPRPVVDAAGNIFSTSPVWASDIWSLKFIGLVYFIDAPTCTFPALHVTYPLIFAQIVYRQHKKWGWHLYVCTLILLVTTWTTKQHFVADGIVGLFTGWLCFKAFLPHTHKALQQSFEM